MVRSHRLAERYDALHRPGAWLRVKDNLCLGCGPFHDQLTIEEIGYLAKELEERLPSTAYTQMC